MSSTSGPGIEVWPASALAALSVDVVTHPIDTLITRMQSPTYALQYKTGNVLFRGLYQGFGPTLITGIPASAAFWVVYEQLKAGFEWAHRAGHLRDVPQPLVHVASSAVGEIVSCAIMNPAEVLKQNAQVSTAGLSREKPSALGGHTMTVMKRFAAHPTKLWTGYSMMVAAHLPGTCITMGTYEYLKSTWLERLREKDPEAASSIKGQVKVAAMSAGVAAGCTSALLVPIDVIKTRMRLSVSGDSASAAPSTRNLEAPRVWQTPSSINFLSVARETLRVDGLRGLFRGAVLTFVTATIGGAMYIGCYEGSKLYFRRVLRGSDGEYDETDSNNMVDHDRIL
ncbi:unnamed protein product [Clonostachys chloroleuca]|uniref:Mitochondrial carrier protein n=1 Tax=Clonostachys chloroleuca TaxID=1926264 RepID=A0AA35PXB6_9HYPO|nr:unnamed protein product [Clonostachys chloroleuca]